MSPEFQSIAALVVVGITATWLIVRTIKSRRAAATGCGGGCGCPTDKFKAGLKS